MYTPARGASADHRFDDRPRTPAIRFMYYISAHNIGYVRSPDDTPPAVKGAGETDQCCRTDLPARSTTATGGGCVREIIRAYLGGFSSLVSVSLVAGDLRG